jgi:uncharacterized RDD family membrane protein YckC
VTAPENPARWAPDPLGRHQYRYWDGAQWTEHVSDNGMVGTDPPIAQAPPQSSTGAPTTAPVPTAAPVPGTGASAWNQPTAWNQPVSAYDPTAVLGRRYGAFLIDAAICLIAFGLIFFASATTRTRAEALRLPGCHLSASDSSQVECNNRAVITVNDTVYEADIGPFFGFSVLFTFLYFALVEGLFGGSLGKQMTGLRVVTPTGEKIGVLRSTARWAVFAVDGPLSLFICGIVTSSVARGHRRLGDMGANSYVVGKADAGRPVTA